MARINGWELDAGGNSNNAPNLAGRIQGGTAQPLNVASSTQRHAIGEKLQFDDDTIFRYVHTVAAVGIGKVASRDNSLTDQAAIVGRLSSKSSTTGAAGDTTYVVGDTEIWIQDSTVFASDTDLENSRAGGYFGISNEGGEGGRYRIQAQSAGDLDETQGMLKITLYPPGLAVALASEATVWLIGPQYKNLKISSANTDAPGLGVMMQTTTAGQYAWMQTRGVANVLCDESAGTVAINSPAVISDGVDGALTVFGQGIVNSEENLTQFSTEAIVGRWLTVGVNASYEPCYVHFE